MKHKVQYTNYKVQYSRLRGMFYDHALKCAIVRDFLFLLITKFSVVQTYHAVRTNHTLALQSV